MAWIPYDSYILNRKLRSGQIKEKFEDSAQRTWDKNHDLLGVVFTNDKNTDSFIADFLINHIKIKEKVDFAVGGYLNSFRPEADIQFRDTQTGTKMKVSIYLNIWVIIFLFLVITFISIAIIPSAIAEVQKGEYKLLSLMCVLFLLIGYFIPTVAFNAELAKLKLFINDLLEIEYSE